MIDEPPGTTLFWKPSLVVVVVSTTAPLESASETSSVVQTLASPT